jgi:group I intron endonuclease
MIIYKVTNAVNNKIYIGQTINSMWYREDQHYRETRSVKKKNTYFHNAISFYGKENFLFEEIDSAESMEELNLKEQYWIYFYKSNQKELGYNLDSGGLNCLKSDETKKKIGEEKRGHWQQEEIRVKMRKGLEKATETWKQNCLREIVEI